MRHPQRRLLPLLLIAIGLCMPSAALAQEEKVSPRVTVVHPGYDKLEADLESLLGLTTKKEQKYKEDLFGILEAFKVGVDGTRPIRVDVLVDRLPYVIVGVPVSDAASFRSSTVADLLGATLKKDRKDKGLYTATEPAGGKFFVREVGKYLYLADQKNDIAPVVLKNFGPDVAGLINRNFSIGAELVNEATGAASQQQRRVNFQTSKKELLAALKQMPSESKQAFESAEA